MTLRSDESFASRDPGRPADAAPSRESIRRILTDLEERVARRVPQARQWGPEHPARAILEVFAEALAEAWLQVEEVEDRVLPTLLETLGQNPHWARGAEGAVVFTHDGTGSDPALVPQAAEVQASRSPGEPALPFETTCDAWCSSARLLRIAASTFDRHAEIVPYPGTGWDGEPVSLFGPRESLARYLYLGDPLLEVLREAGGVLHLQWLGAPSVLAEGRWEVSVRDGWRAARVEMEEARSGEGKRVWKMRAAGPVPDLAGAVVDGSASPWLRLVLPGDRRIVLPQPLWTGLETESRLAPAAAGREDASAASAIRCFPRPVFRLLSRSGERWEDHSLSAEKITAVDAPASWHPAVYMGWDRPVPASVYWSFVRSVGAGAAIDCPAPGCEDLERDGDAARRDAPRLVWEYSTGRAFRPLDVEDGTRAFTRSGVVSWAAPDGWAAQEHLGEKLHWIRARWVAGSYLYPPVVRAVLPHAAAVRQGRRIDGTVISARCRLPRLDADIAPCPDGEPEPFDRLEVRREGDAEWTPLASVDDPRSAEGFTVRPRLRGGCTIRLPARWAGDIQLRLPAVRQVLGSQGNIDAWTVNVLAGRIEGVRGVAQPLAMAGGRDLESPEAYRRRAEAEWNLGGRVVTPADYQRFCMALDPEIARVETAVDRDRPSSVTVCVVGAEPCRPGRIPPARLASLQDGLESRVPAGTLVHVMEAIYVPVVIRARRTGPGPWPSPQTRSLLENRLRSYFHPLHGGDDGRGFPAGRWLNEEALFAIIGGVFSDGCATRPSVGLEQHGACNARGAPGDWDSRLWRFTYTVTRCASGMESSPVQPAGGGALPAAAPLVVPVLERLVFEAC